MKANRSQSTDPWAGLNHNQRCLLPVASAAVSTATTAEAMSSASTTEAMSSDSTTEVAAPSEAATDRATIITIMVSTPKAAEKPSAVVGIIVAIAVWVIIRIVCVGISVK